MEKSKPSEKFDILHSLHVATYSNQARKSLQYPRQIIRLSEELNQPGEQVRAYQDMGISYVMLSMLDSALYFLQKAEGLARKFNKKSAVGSSLRTMGTVYWYRNDYTKALDYYEKSLQIFEDMNDVQQIATTVSNIGLAHYAMGNFEQSIDYLKRGYELIDSAKYPSEASSYLNDIGTIYQEWGNRNKALEYFLKTLRINEVIKNKRHIATNLHNIGSIYFEDKKYHRTLNYFKRGLQYSLEVEDVFGLPYSYMDIGAVYIEMNQPDSALHFLNKALNDFQQNEDKQGLANTMTKVGEVYELKKAYQKSIGYFEKAAELAKEINDRKGEAFALSSLGNVQFYMGNYQDAVTNLTRSAEWAESEGFVYLQQDNYKYLANAYGQLNDKSKQIHYLEKYIAIKDSVLTLEKQKQATELLAKYETKKKQAQIELLNKEKEISRNQLIRQRAIIIIVIVFLGIVVLVTVLLYRRYQEKQRTNALLSQKNKEIQDKHEKIEKQNYKLEEQAQKLRELDEIKTRFFTNISHEFRTPLTLIVGPLEQLIQNSRDKRNTSSLKMILRNAQKLLGLINQLLEISRIEKGHVHLKLLKGDLKSEIGFITEMFTSHAIDKGIKLNFESEDNDLYGYYDKEKLDKILFNLISNAIKNTHEGKVIVKLHKSEKSGYIRVKVSDTGEGIDEGQLPYIFDRFYMADERQSDMASSGIGLAFTKELVKIYKGSIQVNSVKGEGTEFTLELPITQAVFTSDEYKVIEAKPVSPLAEMKAFSQDQAVSSTSTEQGKENKQDTILVVEDHDKLRQFIVNNLVNHFQVIEAANGKDGISIARQKLPDMVITDIMMPEINGMELTRILKNEENTSHIPIIMLTAKASEDSRIEGLETEADDYLTKPFSIRELIVRIKNILRLRQKLREKYRQAKEINPSEITTNSVDEQFLLKLLSIVENNMENPEFTVDLFCEKAGISRTTLHKKLKHLLDQSATEFINTIRLKRAAQLIRQNAGTISEIAYDVGFSNLSYFSRLFKKHFQITPKEMMEGDRI